VKARAPVKLEDRLIYAEVVEGLIRHGLSGKVSLRLRERLRQLGLDVDRPPQTFPVVAWQQCLAVIVEEAFPGVPTEEGFRQLARQHVEGYGRTLLGKATMRVMRLLGPRRMVLRLPHMLGSTDNYTVGVVEERGPTTFELALNSSPMSIGYPEALFESFLTASGAEEPRVKLLQSSAEGSTYQLTWKER
jgi:uncharacterized protein (TIGR02265 family)